MTNDKQIICIYNISVFLFLLAPDDTVEPLQGDDEDGVGGARQGNLSQRQRPGNQHWVNLDKRLKLKVF